MAKTRSKEQTCYECGGQGVIPKAYAPGGYEGYIRFVDQVCSKCGGTGVI